MMLSRTSKALMTGKSLSFESATVWFSPCPLMNEQHHLGSMKIACKTQNLLSGLGFFSRAVYLHRDIEKLLCDSRRTHLWAHSSFFFCANLSSPSLLSVHSGLLQCLLCLSVLIALFSNVSFLLSKQLPL